MTDLLLKYIVQETNEAESRSVEDWIKQSESNKQEYEKYLLLWENSKMPKSNYQPDVDAAWQALQAKIKQGENNVIAFAPKKKYLSIKFAAAAVLLLMLAVISYNTFSPQPTTWTASNEPLNITLPDNSIVVLNRNATLALQKNFNKENRTITLEGEAFFDITPNKSKPFKINANDVEVTVLGTSFNVKTTAAQTEVLVETGLVQVRKNKEAIQLKPEEKATFVKGKKAPILALIDNDLHQYYRTKLFNCNNTPLIEFTNILSEVYNTPITIHNHRLMQLPLTAKFRVTDSLESILEKVATTLNAQVEKSGNTYILH